MHTGRTSCEDRNDTATGRGITRSLEEPRSKAFPSTLRRSMTLVTPWLWTSGFRNCETINFCCPKPPSLWYFVMSTLGNEYTFFPLMSSYPSFHIWFPYLVITFEGFFWHSLPSPTAELVGVLSISFLMSFAFWPLISLLVSHHNLFIFLLQLLA